ncbi:hypothetical protein CCACVL1_00424 [Corchorus capsularis]|uniref:Uncharacterized protein n=1 Tax=Corchorus capsularis TaxID=210143 RepID=A0A1R3KWY0_COCAP|nr:hypothetical protein CCACVL1_00424 [Corchorus capsularis]
MTITRNLDSQRTNKSELAPNQGGSWLSISEPDLGPSDGCIGRLGYKGGNSESRSRNFRECGPHNQLPI